MKRWWRRNCLYVLAGALLIGVGLVSYNIIHHMAGLFWPAEETGEVRDPEPPGISQPRYTCPLDGAALDSLPEHRPLAVMIDNAPEASPHYGLAQADLVWEAPVEGGITRLMAVFYHGRTGTIGPIRSARPYFIAWAQDFQAVLVHMGESPQAQVMLKQNSLDHLDEYSHSSGFWRERQRRAPHNLYSSTDRLWQEIGRLGYDRETRLAGFPFLTPGEEPPGETAYRLEIAYPLKYERVRYEYQEGQGVYLRFMGNKPHQDGESGKQLTAQNIIVQYVESRVIDDQGRLEMAYVGEGEAMVFTRGKVQQARWVKGGLEEPTRYLDSRGRDINLSPGQTWIEVVSPGMKVEYGDPAGG